MICYLFWGAFVETMLLKFSLDWVDPKARMFSILPLYFSTSVSSSFLRSSTWRGFPLGRLVNLQTCNKLKSDSIWNQRFDLNIIILCCYYYSLYLQYISNIFVRKVFWKLCSIHKIITQSLLKVKLLWRHTCLKKLEYIHCMRMLSHKFQLFWLISFWRCFFKSTYWGQYKFIVCLDLPPPSLKYPRWQNFISKKIKNFFLLFNWKIE